MPIQFLSFALITALLFAFQVVHAAGGTWSTLTPAPTQRTEVTAAVLDGRIYVMGGFADPSLSNFMSFAVTDKVEVYDPASDSWQAAPSLPEKLHHAGAVTVDGRLYVVGGFTPGFMSIWNPVATAYRFDPADDKWTQLPSMPTARGALGVAVLDGKIHAVGGLGEDGNSSAVEVYDPRSNSWSSRAPLPTPRDHLAAAVVGERLFAIGGRIEGSYGRNLDVTEAYDPAADQWTKAAPLPTARSGIAAGVIDGGIHVLGGEAPQGTFQENEVYDPAADQWRTAAPMPTARHGLGAAVVGGRLYAISGGTSPGGSFSSVIERFTPAE